MQVELLLVQIGHANDRVPFRVNVAPRWVHQLLAQNVASNGESSRCPKTTEFVHFKFEGQPDGHRMTAGNAGQKLLEDNIHRLHLSESFQLVVWGIRIW